MIFSGLFEGARGYVQGTGAMPVSEAMNIPGMQHMEAGMHLPISAPLAAPTPRHVSGTTPRWAWPMPGTSLSRLTPIGASPFGRSVDMVDVVAQLMEGERACSADVCHASHCAGCEQSHQAAAGIHGCY